MSETEMPLTLTSGKDQTAYTNDYLIILRDEISKQHLNLQREAESDEMIKMLWHSYNPASLAMLWQANMDDTTVREDDIVLEAIIRLDSVTETEVLFDDRL